MKVRDPAVLDRVKVGDTVVVTLTEALRVEVVGALMPYAHRRMHDADAHVMETAEMLRECAEPGGARAAAAGASWPRSRRARTSA